MVRTAQKSRADRLVVHMSTYWSVALHRSKSNICAKMTQSLEMYRKAFIQEIPIPFCFPKYPWALVPFSAVLWRNTVTITELQEVLTKQSDKMNVTQNDFNCRWAYLSTCI